jgi:pterin-4a-carbinolamine dehydratase
MDTTQTNLDLPGGDNPLKPERVQKGAALAAAGAPLRQESVHERLRREHAQEQLKALPGWQMTADAKTLNRAKEFPTPEVACLYSAFVTGFAGALSLPVAVNVSGGQVVVTLHAKRNRGRLGPVTDAVLDFARRLG